MYRPIQANKNQLKYNYASGLHAAFNFTRAELDPAHYDVVCCEASEVAAEAPTADMLVPLMTRVDSALISRASRLRCILQFGVGLEGVDIPAAKQLGIRVANIPSESTGNAASCAEMALSLAQPPCPDHSSDCFPALATSARERTYPFLSSALSSVPFHHA